MPSAFSFFLYFFIFRFRNFDFFRYGLISLPAKDLLFDRLVEALFFQDLGALAKMRIQFSVT
jgi:hypothetical protein